MNERADVIEQPFILKITRKWKMKTPLFTNQYQLYYDVKNTTTIPMTDIIYALIANDLITVLEIKRFKENELIKFEDEKVHLCDIVKYIDLVLVKAVTDLLGGKKTKAWKGEKLVIEKVDDLNIIAKYLLLFEE